MSTKSDQPDVEIAQQLDRLMRRIHGGLNASAASFDQHRLGPNGGIILLTIAEIEPARMQDLVARVARDKSQMTRVVSLLETKGLVSRREAPDDARARLMSLTPLGRAAVREIETGLASVVSDVLSPLTDQEHETLKALLKRL